MGHKTNPILFRLNKKQSADTLLCSAKEVINTTLLHENRNIVDFLTQFLHQKGIILRKLKVEKKSDRLIVALDLYFSYLLAKRAQFLGVRTLYREAKKKYKIINRIGDLKNFKKSFSTYGVLNKKDSILRFHSQHNKKIVAIRYEERFFAKKRVFTFKRRDLTKKGFYQGKTDNSPKLSDFKHDKFGISIIHKGTRKRQDHVSKLQSSLRKVSKIKKQEKGFNPLSVYISTKKKISSLEKKKLIFKIPKKAKQPFLLSCKNPFFFLYFQRKNKKALLSEEDYRVNLGFTNTHGFKHKKVSPIIRLPYIRLKRLFVLKKINKVSKRLYAKNFSIRKNKQKIKLSELNEKLCKILSAYTGVEKIELRIKSQQMKIMPIFSLYKKIIIDKLFYFQKRKDIEKFFFESVECMFFIFGTYGKGNAKLLGVLIKYMLENVRKQMNVVKFLKKLVAVFHQSLNHNFYKIEGIRIAIKGRFNKRPRTKTRLIQKGEISLQTLNKVIDYSQIHAFTVYGCFGIKVWISKNITKKKLK